MRISDAVRGAALGLVGLALAGCDPASLAAGSPSRARVSVAGESIVIAAPPGFCVDARSTRVDSGGAFVLMSDCSLLGVGGTTRAPAIGAVLTASVSPGGLGGEGDDPAGSLEDLQGFVGTAEGRAVVGRSGQPERIRILNSQTRDGVLYVLVEDRGRLPIAGIDRRFWRAFLEVNGRMTALSELGFAGAGVSPQEGLNQLAALAAAIKQANAHGMIAGCAPAENAHMNSIRRSIRVHTRKTARFQFVA